LLYIWQQSAIPIDGAVGQQPVCGVFTPWHCNSDGSCLRKTMNNRGRLSWRPLYPKGRGGDSPHSKLVTVRYRSSSK
jgi:hypothetical protein